MALVLSAARLVDLLQGGLDPGLAGLGGSSPSSSATDAFSAAASAQAGDAAAVVPLAAVVVVAAAAAPLVSSPEPPQAAAARQTMARSRSLAGMGARMLSSRGRSGRGSAACNFRRLRGSRHHPYQVNHDNLASWPVTARSLG